MNKAQQCDEYFQKTVLCHIGKNPFYDILAQKNDFFKCEEAYFTVVMHKTYELSVNSIENYI